MAGQASAASPIIAGCSIPNVFTPCCSTSAAAAAAGRRDRARHNTLPHLIADMEAIRDKFGFERWMVVGGSWGATLALAYAQAHPQRVSGLVLRATFLGTYEEIESGFCERLPRFYPGLYDDFLSLLPEGERARPLDAYWRRILDPDPAVHGPAARAWHDTERILSEHTPTRTRLDLAALKSNGALPATPFMEAHYFVNDCFMKPNQLMKKPASSPAFPESSCRAATICCVRRRSRMTSPRAGRMRRCAPSKARAIRCMIPACATRS